MIAIEATIGAGKTEAADLLGERLGFTVYHEPVANNPVLPMFYKEPVKYGFLLQMAFLNARLEQINEASKTEPSVLDRYIRNDALIYQMNVDMGRGSQIEADVQKDLMNTVIDKMKEPQLIIYIQVSLETALERIKKRGRSFEQISNDPNLYPYYAELNKRYRKWYDEYTGNKMLINGDKYDFVENKSDKEIVLGQMATKIRQLGIIKEDDK